jgi:hypothetical protein
MKIVLNGMTLVLHCLPQVTSATTLVYQNRQAAFATPLSWKVQLYRIPSTTDCNCSSPPTHIQARCPLPQLQHGRLPKSGDATENSTTRLNTTITDDAREDSTHGKAELTGEREREDEMLTERTGRSATKSKSPAITATRRLESRSTSKPHALWLHSRTKATTQRHSRLSTAQPT